MKALARYAVMVIALLGGTADRGSAATIYDSRAAWEADHAAFWQIDLSFAAPGTLLDTLAIGVGHGTLDFDADLERVDVPDTWGTWSSGEPNLLYHFSSFSVTATFSQPFTGGFGLTVQPDLFGVFPITLALSDGSTLVQQVDGFGGAKFFGWDGTGITSFTLSCVDCGFAFGEVVAAPAVPEPATLGLIGVGLVAIARVTGGRRSPSRAGRARSRR